MSKRDVGQRVLAFRRRRGLSQYELAASLGTDQANISNIERGKRGVTIHQVVKLAKVLGVSTDEILIGDKMGKRVNGAFPKDRRFVRRLHQVDQLSKRHKQALLATIDAFLKSSPTELS